MGGLAQLGSIPLVTRSDGLDSGSAAALRGAVMQSAMERAGTGTAFGSRHTGSDNVDDGDDDEDAGELWYPG